jgi:ribonuclease BN (tRNA processing enzyme)
LLKARCERSDKLGGLKEERMRHPAKRHTDMTRRQLITGAAHVAAFGAIAQLLPSRTAFAQRGTGATGAVPVLPPTGTQLVLLGTQGGPNVNLRRTQASNAVVVDGRPYLIDCGYGTVRSLVASGIGYQQVGTVFITHLHDDHTTDLPALLTQQWTGSKASPTAVYGPFGTAALVDAAVAFLKTNADIRIVDEGRTTRPEALYKGNDVAAGSSPAQAFADDRIKVTSVENMHFPERAKANMKYRSLAYRIQTPTRSIVISGDTAYSPGLVELARGADLFVCEVIDLSIYDAMVVQAKAAEAKGNFNSVARHVAETHSTTVDVGRMAAEAKVKTLVLSHLLPGSNRNTVAEFPDTTYIEGVRKHFSGQVIIGRDEMVL